MKLLTKYQPFVVQTTQLCLQISITLLNALINTWPRVHKAFHNQDQDHAQVKQLSTTDFL